MKSALSEGFSEIQMFALKVPMIMVSHCQYYFAEFIFLDFSRKNE